MYLVKTATLTCLHVLCRTVQMLHSPQQLHVPCGKAPVHTAYGIVPLPEDNSQSGPSCPSLCNGFMYPVEEVQYQLVKSACPTNYFREQET